MEPQHRLLRQQQRGRRGRRPRPRRSPRADDDDRRRRSRDEGGGEREYEDGGRSILGNLEEEAPPGTGDRARRARDSALLADSFQQTVALAEIIVPGIDLPTFDQSARPAKTFDDICGLRRNVLGKAYGTTDGKARIDEITGGRTFDAKTLDCSRVRGLYLSLGAITKLANNTGGSSRARDDAGAGGGGGAAAPKVKTLAEINKENADFWAKHSPAA